MFLAQSKQIHHLFFSLYYHPSTTLPSCSHFRDTTSVPQLLPSIVLSLFEKKTKFQSPSTVIVSRISKLHNIYKIIQRNMEVSLPPAKSPLIGSTNKPERKFPASPRFQCRDSSPHVSRRPMRTTATSYYSLRKVHGSANKEIIKRALTPPARRPTLRWLDFKPTPSRLCNMSAA